MKVRKIEKDSNGNLKVRWFRYPSTKNNQTTYESPFLDVKTKEDYLQLVTYQIYGFLNVVKGELKDKTWGIKGVFGKQSKEEIDMEIQEGLSKKLNLVITSYVSKLEDRNYTCRFTVTTPKGYEITIEEIM